MNMAVVDTPTKAELEKLSRERLEKLGVNTKGKTMKELEEIVKNRLACKDSYEARKKLAISRSGSVEAFLKEVLKDKKSKPKPQREKPRKQQSRTPLERSRQRRRNW